MLYNVSIQPPMTLKIFAKTPSEKKNGNETKTIFQEKDQDEKEEFKRDFILCKACNNKITYSKEKINVSGLHHHTFANPSGIIYDIGCYKTAPGCLRTGPFTDEFSWFKGYMWRVSICASCLAHLGWLFLSSNKNSFYGLIVDRLIESE